MGVCADACSLLDSVTRRPSLKRWLSWLGSVGFDCRVGGWPAWTAFVLDGGAAAIALDDSGVVDESVDGGEGHGLAREHLSPFAERLVGCDQQPLVAQADELERNAGLGLILADEGDVVEDEEVILVELGQRPFEGELAPCHL